MADFFIQRIVPYLLLPAGSRSEACRLPIPVWSIPFLLLLPKIILFRFRDFSKRITNFALFFNARNYELLHRSACLIRAVIRPAPVGCRKIVVGVG